MKGLCRPLHVVLWLHTSSQTKPNLLQIWTKEERCSSKQKGSGWRAVHCFIHALQYIPLLLYHRGSELNLPLEAVFLSVRIRTFKKESWLVSRVYALLFFFPQSSFFFSTILFSLCGLGKPKSCYSFPLNVGPIKHTCGFSY